MRAGVSCHCRHRRKHFYVFSGMAHKGSNDCNSTRSRGKIQNSNNFENTRNWLDLPIDMLMLVFLRLNLIETIAFGGVCKSWSLFATANKQYILEKEPPLVVIISKHVKRSLRLYNAFDQTMCKTMLPLFSGRKCSGLSSGYLIMEDKSHSNGLWLVNPLTRNEYHLPFWQKSAYRVVLASSTTDPSQVMIFTVSCVEGFRMTTGFRLMNNTVINNFSFTDLGLSRYGFFGRERLVDMIFFRGNIYGLAYPTQVGVMILTSNCGTFTSLKVPTIRLSFSARLVASSEKLLLVDSPFQMTEHKIYELNFSRMEWSKVVSLGDEALFVCDQAKSISLCNTIKWGGRSNCIYHLCDETNRCSTYSLDGRFFESFPINEERNGRSVATSHHPVWYFPHEAYNIPSINMD